MQRFFELADKDGSGSLDFNEFATTLVSWCRCEGCMIDSADATGIMTHWPLQATANNLSDQQRLEWTYKLFDRDKNGQLEVPRPLDAPCVCVGRSMCVCSSASSSVRLQLFISHSNNVLRARLTARPLSLGYLLTLPTLHPDCTDCADCADCG